MSDLIRPLVKRLKPYVPGEQPRIKGLIKLNTNENPYPPAPAVLRAIQKATDTRLRLYPNPTAQNLRVALAEFHDCLPENIIVGNGSDELLALAVRAFVEPVPEAKGSGASSGQESRHRVQYFNPSYSLYPVLAESHGALSHSIPLESDFALPSQLWKGRHASWDRQAALTLITTPNAPSGRGYSTDELRRLCQWHRGAIVLDEAYVDFADDNALQLGLELPNVLVARTFSKAYSLCFLRMGYMVGSSRLIGALDKLRDSYNVNGLGQIAAEATLRTLSYYRRNFQKVRRSRERAVQALTALGFVCLPSQTNFILVKPPRFPAREWLELLRERKILVRWFNHPNIDAFLRITIGTENEMGQLLKAVRAILQS